MRDRRWWATVMVVAITLPWLCLWVAVYAVVVVVGSFDVATVLGVSDLAVNLALIGVGGFLAGLVGGFAAGIRRWGLLVVPLVVAAAGLGAHLLDEALGLGHWGWFGVGLVTGAQSLALLVAASLVPITRPMEVGEVHAVPAAHADRHRVAA